MAGPPVSEDMSAANPKSNEARRMSVAAVGIKDGLGRRDMDTESLSEAKRSPRDKKTALFEDSDEEESAKARLSDQHRKIVRSWLRGNEISLSPGEYDSVRFEANSDKQNLLHRTIIDFKKEKRKSNSDSTRTASPQDQRMFTGLRPIAITYIEELLVEKPELFTEQDESPIVPMFEFPKLDASVLFRVIKLLIPVELIESLGKTGNICAKNASECPLWRVNNARREQCIKGKRAKASGGKAAPVSAVAVAALGPARIEKQRECLHDKVDVAKMKEEDAKLRRVLKVAMRAPDACTKVFKELLHERYFDGDLMEVEPFTTLLSLCPDNLFKEVRMGEQTPLQMAVQLYEKQSINYRRLSLIIQALVERCPESIFVGATNDKEKGTVYRQLKKLGKGMTEDCIRSRSDTEELFKRTCIGFPDKEPDAKSEFLSWDLPSSKRFHLSLKGESATLSQVYINDMKELSGIKFETALDFVRLPYWNPNAGQAIESAGRLANESQQRVRGHGAVESRSAPDYLDPYEAIFDWLWGEGVRKIFTLEVDDTGPEPHTNLSIRKALCENLENENLKSRFGIKVWNWRKFDICLDTVATAAPEATEVHLYSHGNTSVLRGWACDTNLKRMEKLEKLVVEIQPLCANDEADCIKYQDKFIEKIRTQCPQLSRDSGLVVKVVQFSVDHNRQRTSEDTDRKEAVKKPLSSDAVIPKSPEWIKRLDPFLGFLDTVSRRLKHKPSVKVAILDDGCKLNDLEGPQICESLSFRPHREEYFVGPCSHGTEMARCIRAVCPEAGLYIARLDDSRQAENQRFTIASCYKALEWAEKMNVDIISMSWTFRRQNSEYDAYHDLFVKKIESLKNDGKVVLLASLPDKGIASETHSFVPVGLPGVIKIGSATAFGELARENLFEQADYIFPGEAKLSTKDEIGRGSSFATAYAAGLAAMVQYCVWALKMLSDDDEKENEKFLQVCRSTDGMRTIFDNMSTKTSNDKNEQNRFVQPYRTFQADSAVSHAEHRHILKNIVNEILPTKDLKLVYT